MGKAKAVSSAGRRRVERAFELHGLLITQGQREIPSVADLLEGAPITTHGYSWDYVTAWNESGRMAGRPDVSRAKLFRGRSTLIAKRLWPAVDALARDARERLGSRTAPGLQRRFLELAEARPGIPVGELRESLGLDAKTFQRIKGQLEQKLCLFGVEREDLDYHTHESCCFPWSDSKIAKGVDQRWKRPETDDAIDALLRAVYPKQRPAKPPRISTLFPVLR